MKFIDFLISCTHFLYKYVVILHKKLLKPLDAQGIVEIS